MPSILWQDVQASDSVSGRSTSIPSIYVESGVMVTAIATTDTGTIDTPTSVPALSWASIGSVVGPGGHKMEMFIAAVVGKTMTQAGGDLTSSDYYAHGIWLIEDVDQVDAYTIVDEIANFGSASLQISPAVGEGPNSLYLACGATLDDGDPKTPGTITGTGWVDEGDDDSRASSAIGHNDQAPNFPGGFYDGTATGSANNELISVVIHAPAPEGVSIPRLF